MFDNGEIENSIYKYLLNKECRTPILYLLPKIHKGTSPPRGRPIISAVSSHTKKISEFVDHLLNPCAQRASSYMYIRYTIHFLTSLEEVKDLPENTWLVTGDVISLYMMIPNASGLHAAKEALREFRPNPQVKPSNDSLIQLLEFFLTNNNFKFNGEHYLQVGGTSMVTKMAPCNANTCMGKFEEDFVYGYPSHPIFWKR